MKTPESVLKKQATQAKLAEVALKASKAAKKKKKADKKTFTENAAKYEAEYAAADKEAIANRRKAKASGGFYVPAEPKLALIIRIRGIIGVSPKAKKIMQLFRLRQIHNATFVRMNEATTRMLRLIEPYVTYGYPTRATIEKLIYKRGFGKINKQRIPIAENSVIEEGLKGTDIRCCADLVHEIVTVGPNFKKANNFLWPFKLSAPDGGFSRKTKLLHFMEGGEAGNRGEEINKLVKRML
uniref:Ribosomal protein L30 ferredoxin-like fold domain-containing protein n=1 Tax=Pseudictyota dubia TaxID=2749911 RepID=A0A7R9VW21_9STRA|mmetsp:Transcript_23889/g.44131  ORF Transcript_23889/g.44131 Transcript_23889/m.44131 type:complete len:240 (+) Transcript_23889:58-777(+)|eukprot:CAMPEP_0197434812 /NCGR_PEP_ID=MMETSP1175-20131217/2496_1 /TAXON_ID=1003142 /ORGANISM="Triceratium dubium, Strain CCMP147" /LENGTH=239 /DNA_ID=CAMNT_0042963667 /DNA_START=27 /DNA_END=746 /DNA_ORIENTATION=+